MDIRDWLFVILLTILWLAFNLLGNLAFFDLIYLQFIFAAVMYLFYRTNLSLGVALIILFVSDASLGINLSFSILSFTVVGFLLSILGRIYPLFKQQPFIQGRVFWVTGCVILYTIMKANFQVVEIVEELVAAILINNLILITVTYMIEPFLARRGGGDIVIG